MIPLFLQLLYIKILVLVFKTSTPEIVAYDSFADVYQATYRGRKVALKRIRISRSLSDEDKMRCHRVRYFTSA